MKWTNVVPGLLLTVLCQQANAQQRFAVVELFTSERNSNCLQAERMLERIVAPYGAMPVYVLQLHVDDDNQPGWKDVYSSKMFTERQRSYMASVKTKADIPQVIINGSKAFEGTDSVAIATYLKQCLQAITAVPNPVCTIKRSGQKITLNCRVDQALANQTIYAVLVQKQAQNSIPEGKNRGLTLQHTNVARDMDSNIVKRSSVKLSVAINGMPNLDNYEVIVFTQQPQSLQITSAVMVSLL